VDSRRLSGILLHITSLPSAYGIGDLGPAAYRFADFLTRSEQRLWQILPLGPVGPTGSPYAATSTRAGNPLLISPEPLLEYGLLHEDDLEPLRALPQDHVDYDAIRRRKRTVLETAFDRFLQDGSSVAETSLTQFRREEEEWLAEYAVYAALKDVYDGAPWMDWPAPLARRESEAIARARNEHGRTVRKHVFWQYLFHQQWSALQAYCRSRDIRLFGDLPLYPAHDSADVWANQELFQLDEDGQPTAVAGVPPDYFNPEGQRWGHPLYRWEQMEENGFAWWTSRMRRAMEQFDLVRLDHFRGFDEYWRIPAGQDTAVNGEWAKGPGASLLRTLKEELGPLPVVAEDLGIIDDSVETLRDDFDVPGMAVLQFAFDEDPANDFLPHNHRRNLVAYTGTHDTATIAQWWETHLSDQARDFARGYLDLNNSSAQVHEQCIRYIMASVADRAVFPMQDVLGLGGEARMNTPGEPTGNWTWRVRSNQITNATEDFLATLTRLYGRVRTYD